ncbi:MAG: hypothetical protein KGO02_19755 [Alphaproteobacteria bacterium]|nr:hypothetical protein [Alphaproteobacteria bacterium]
MALSEAPLVALALIRSFGCNAFDLATHRADDAARDGKFATAYEWRRIAEIIRDEIATGDAPDDEDDAKEAQHATGLLHQPLIAPLVRRMHLLLLLTQRPGWGWDPFGPDLEPWKTMGLADDGEMFRTSRTADGYEHLLDSVGLPSAACAACAGHLVCAEVRRILTDRAHRLCLEEHTSRHPGDGDTQKAPAERSREAVARGEETSGATRPPAFSPCEREIRDALVTCWMRKSGFTPARNDGRPCPAEANP